MCFPVVVFALAFFAATVPVAPGLPAISVDCPARHADGETELRVTGR
jgi:hypothetical protein